jgi:uncharacterized membrane protein YdjX (TVP38/TMEM64 family)
MGVKRRLEIRDWLNIVALLLLLALFVCIGRAYSNAFGHMQGGGLLATAENLRLFILSYGRWGLAIMIGLHALHVIITVIPSGLVQFSGGLIYGMGLGMLSGFIGITLGSAVSFYLSRLLGRRVVTMFVSEKNLRKLDGLAVSDRTSLILLLLFILPVPKDFLAYLAGLTDMRAGRFLLISALGRLPGMLAATYLGAHLLQRDYLLLGLAVTACAAAALLAYIYRQKILALASKK